MIATAQYLNVAGSDLFSGILLSKSYDDGKTWTEFEVQNGLKPIECGERITVGCDATPMYHKKTDQILLLGHTAEYEKDAMHPSGRKRHTFYSVFDKDKEEFRPMKFLEMPKGFEICGNGSGQSVELENGELLIPGYYKDEKGNCVSAVVRCVFDGEDIEVIEAGNSLTVSAPRGLGEPSVVKHNGTYYMALRNDVCGYVAMSEDGVHYHSLQPWCWDDGELLPTYNTQQHWMTLGDKLYLVYTRRYAKNDHVFRHRAPLFAAEVENMRVKRETEFIVVKEKGARLGNFGVTQRSETKVSIMAAEWMQPIGCEKYGSDNSIYLVDISI